MAAAHLAAGEWLRLLSAYAPAGDAEPGRTVAGQRYPVAFGGLTAVTLAAGMYALADTHVAAAPVKAWWYRVVPLRFEGSVAAGSQLGHGGEPVIYPPAGGSSSAPAVPSALMIRS